MHQLKTFDIFDFEYIHLWYMQNFMLLGSSVQILWQFWDGARSIKFFWSKSLKTEYAIKSRDLLRFHSNFATTPILLVNIC